MDEDKNPRYLPMHRFLQVEILNKKGKESQKGFGLDNSHTNNLSFEY
ncbi:MAG: hypothetical protein CM15mP22_2870 [Gammaproteobacteria bacterium]|nr:MAG: hypothetical protein CM15mP22_2870 [Gammaproteobacteria bacterium]